MRPPDTLLLAWRPIMRLAVATLTLCSSALAFRASSARALAPRVRASSRSVPIFAREGDNDGVTGAVGGAVLGGLLAGP